MDRRYKNLPKELVEHWLDIPQPGVVHSSDACIFANRPFASLFGYSRPEELSGRLMGEFISPWPSGVTRMGRREATGRRRDRVTFDVEIISMPFYAAGEMIYQSIIKDISELRSWEDRLLQSERLTAMGKLAGEIAHEINNPLGGILLYANLIHEDLPVDSQARGNLVKIIKLATRCRIIAKGLLNFGRSSSKTYVSLDLNKVINEMYSLIEDHKILKNVRTRFINEPGLPHIMGDKGQMEQVVLNLIINAGEAMNGKGELTIATRRLEGAKMVELMVSDTGPGIPKAIIPRIFEPFFTTKRPNRGTGLGLSITHGIVQRHGGKIDVESTPGQGTTFRIILPVRPSG